MTITTPLSDPNSSLVEGWTALWNGDLSQAAFARLVVDDGWPISEVATRLQVFWPTVKRWVDRYLAGESMDDRSSRPHTSPNKTSQATTKRCVSLPIRLQEGPVQLAARLRIASSTVHRILGTARLNRAIGFVVVVYVLGVW
jgi:transposase-like protein